MLFRPLKVGMTRLGQKYLNNRRQLSKKLWATPLDSILAFKNAKLSIFDLMSHRGRVYSISLVARKSALKPKKVTFSGQNSQKWKDPKLLLTQRNDLYRRVCLVELYQNPPRKVQMIFGIRPPYRGNSGSAIN